MSNYQLNIVINAADLSTIYAANESIILIKSSEGEKPFSWLSFKPFESNLVTWAEDYSIYTTNQTESSGTIINFFTHEPAVPSQNYNFLNDGTFSQPNPVPIGASSYQITNQNTSVLDLSFGLIQAANVNGVDFENNPINVQFVPQNQYVIFKPLTQLAIFLASNISAGTVISPDSESGVISQSTAITFPNGVYEITVTYNASTGGFVQNS